MVVTTGGGTTQMVETRVEIRKVHFLFEPVVWICGPLIIVGIVLYYLGITLPIFVENGNVNLVAWYQSCHFSYFIAANLFFALGIVLYIIAYFRQKKDAKVNPSGPRHGFGSGVRSSW